jgi:energy-converting hydrogenase Eha subunit A
MALMFIGERIIGSGSSGRVAFLVIGLLLSIGAMVLRARRARAASEDRRAAESILLRLYGVALVAVAIYAVQSDLPTLRGGLPLEHNWPKLATALSALWPSCGPRPRGPCSSSSWLRADGEGAAPRDRPPQGRDVLGPGPRLRDRLRLHGRLRHGGARQEARPRLLPHGPPRRGRQEDRAHARRAPRDRLVLPERQRDARGGRQYLNDLVKESGQLKVSHYDFDIDPLKAKEYGVSTNGTLVFIRGRRHELLGMPVPFEAARNALKTLDKEVQQRLMIIVRQTRMGVFTLGHGERSWNPAARDTDKRPGIMKLRELMADQSYDVREFGPSDGLAQDIPKDATTVFIIGPQQPFTAEESASINRFVDRGGRLLVALDPENNVTLKEILDPLQLEYHAGVTLASDQAFVPRHHQISDRANLVTASFSSHAAVSTLSRLGARAPVVLPGCGWIDAKRGRPIEIQVDAPIKAHYSTFEDKNGNFQADPGEARRAWEVSGATSKGLARAFVLADSDAFSDDAIAVAGNELMVLDVMHWLMGDEVYSGLVASEMDLPITHTRKQDVRWFYSTIFLAPMVVLGIGYLTTKRRRRKAPAAAEGVTS